MIEVWDSTTLDTVVKQPFRGADGWLEKGAHRES